jgi:hypothetical protein
MPQKQPPESTAVPLALAAGVSRSGAGARIEAWAGAQPAMEAAMKESAMKRIDMTVPV